MKRSTFVKTLLSTAAVGTVSSCTTIVPQGPDSGASGNWPGPKFTTVRAFAYCCEAADDYSFWQKDGSMHPGVLNAPGVVLSPTQVSTLLQTANTPTPKKQRIVCYIPHHAFVFYDSANAVVATLEVCFTCDRCKSFPGGIPSHIDIAPLWKMLHELGVPANATPGYYKTLYDAKRARH